MHHLTYFLVFTTLFFTVQTLSAGEPLQKKPKIISVKKIWDKAQHAAFTDLIRFQGIWYCVFRESDEHAGGSPGKIRLLTSTDGDEWQSAALFAEKNIDLRDPKLSITPDNRLMLLMGGSKYSKEGHFITRQPKVAFSRDGNHWTSFTNILEPHEWLWRVTWHEGKAYGISYRCSNLTSENGDWIATLFVSNDGIHFTKVTQLNVPGHPSEATLRFLKTGEMVALIRRGGCPDNHAWIGVSKPPFVKWHWEDTQLNFGGPDFLILPDQSMWASGRIIEKNPNSELSEKTVLAQMDLQGIQCVLDLLSGGDDTSYPGMVYHNGELWISYYSSHEGDKATIYLARINITGT